MLLTQSLSRCCVHHELFRAEVIHTFSADAGVFLGGGKIGSSVRPFMRDILHILENQSRVFLEFIHRSLRNFCETQVSSQNTYVLLVITVYYLALLIINK